MKSKELIKRKEQRDKVISEILLANTKDSVAQLSDLDIATQLRAKYKTLTTINIDSVRKYVTNVRVQLGIKTSRGYKQETTVDPAEEKEIIFNAVKKLITKKAYTLTELANQFNKAPKDIQEIINKLKEQKYNIIQDDDAIEMSDAIPQGGQHVIDLRKFQNKLYRIGIISDNHLCSKFERLDILNAIYDTFEKEGIKEVYNAGNWIDGEASFNKFEIHTSGVTPQVEYFVKNYPQRKGITTYYIAGDDHEGWYVQRERINIGEYAQMKAREAGRNDLVYLGYVEADIVLQAKEGKGIMKIMHPGGGSSYALSYSVQKIIESFTGGEKPNVLIIGHFHKSEFLPSYRGVQVVQAGCTQNQTIFMRKKKLAAHLGGWILEFQQSKDGAISRFKTEWLNFYDKEYYNKNGYYR